MIGTQTEQKLSSAIHASGLSWLMSLADTAIHFVTLTSADIQSSCRIISMAPEYVEFAGNVEANTTALRLRWS
jgi:hypothetical protein